ncbi:maleylpyruvate isomerase family mycothiol-dependent enzyme [Thermoactinospora rubra]|uniref:maleylpyruvate isomerase family mycothiol-dependent enzyme n=1 Tax=Thermoactinospora rubra TaxID=1088767 RepID=UPI000A102F0E|nr:maleylpyruvate isomerase family mycothiol-dependent enzyme [Thermoactinospora rubra]
MSRGLALLERAISYTRGSLVLVTPEDLTRPTPCAAWDLRALLAHMDDSLAALSEAADVGEVGPPGPLPRDRPSHPEGPGDGRAGENDMGTPSAPSTPGTRPGGVPPGRAPGRLVPEVDVLRRRACRLLGAWTWAGEEGAVTVGGCSVTAMTVAAVGAIEIAVHGWDVARACGRDRPLPAALAEELLEFAPLFVADDDRPHRFGPRVAVVADADPGDRLLAFLGRRPAEPV